VRYAPHGLHFDAYLGRVVHTWRPWGNRNPLHKLILAIARRQLKKAAATQHKTQQNFWDANIDLETAQANAPLR
jgi:hypothetical protein